MWPRTLNASLMAVALASAPALVWAQDVTGTSSSNSSASSAALPTNSTQGPKGGFEIAGVSGYAVYYSSSLPNNGTFQPGTVNLSSDVGYGGSITFDWTKFSERTSFSVGYTPAYTARWRYSSVNSFNHLFTLNLSRKLAPRWTFGWSLGANLSTYEESLFAPNALSGVASVPASFTDFSAGLIASKFSNNPLLGVALTNAPVAASPVSTLLYGERELIASASTSLSYSYSPRLSISVTGGGGRTQTVSSDVASKTPGAYALPPTTSASGSVSFSYSLSPRSQVGGSVSTNWTSSSLTNSYTTTSLITLGRTLDRRWVVQVHGGVGKTNIVRTSFLTLATQPRPAFGGTLGYKTGSHTFLGSYDRSSVDGYGLGASTTSTSTVAWRWQHPGRTWWIEASMGWQQLSDAGYGNISGWHTTVALDRALSDHAVLQTSYAYLSYSGGSLPGGSSNLANLAAYSSAQNAIRVVLTWTPKAIAPRPTTSR